MRTSNIERHDTDILILGTGGAGLFAALHAQQTAPEGTKITIAVKGLIGKPGCTRMVQGGYNVALGGGDTVERHFTDTINGANGCPIRTWHGVCANRPWCASASWRMRLAASLTATPTGRCTRKHSPGRQQIARFTKAT